MLVARVPIANALISNAPASNARTSNVERMDFFLAMNKSIPTTEY